MLTRLIPSSREPMPVIGLGTWQTFDVVRPTTQGEVLDELARAGGRLVDSSPMYGRAEAVVGALRDRIPNAFLATKVWTSGREAGIAQMNESMRLLRAKVIDLMQIHNLVDWRTHLATLRDWKSRGRIRYLGITHYTRSAFADLESIVKREAIDFVQLPLSVELPDAEERLLPLAAERGVAVLVNRPFEGGSLIRAVARTPLPAWAGEFDCRSWSELFLRWIVSHEEVTCVIPATANREHLLENVRAGEGRMLDGKERAALRARLLSAGRTGS